jgi:hypothetical protein
MIPIYGTKLKGCKIPESAHMITFFNILRRDYPEYGNVAIHVRNEGKRTKQQIDKERIEGFVKGACDIIIVGNPALCIEMKSRATSAKVSPEQIQYLLAAQKLGAFVCVAYGFEAALEAFNDWKSLDK